VTAAELLEICQRHGVALMNEGGMLRFRAPKGLLSPKWKAALAEHKTELLALLRAAASQADGLVAISPAPARKEDDRPVWVLYPTGYPDKVFTLDRIPPEATYWCQEGDKKWKSIKRNES
jgi:hypothetical protein